MADQTNSETDWKRLRASGRVYMLIVLAILSFVCGLFLAQPLMFVSVPVVVLLGFTALRSEDPRADVEVVRTTEKVRIREGDRTRVRLRVANLGARGIPMLQVRDGVPRDLRVREDDQRVLPRSQSKGDEGPVL